MNVCSVDGIFCGVVAASFLSFSGGRGEDETGTGAELDAVAEAEAVADAVAAAEAGAS